MAMSLTKASRAMQGALHGADAAFAGVSTDTRTLVKGNLFFALTGDRFDGHDMLEQAAERGATGAVVERRMAATLPQIVTRNSRRSLGDLAHAWRREMPARVLGITGSNGKTTVKEMCATILRQDHQVLATRGNLNNDIGVPLTLFGLDRTHDFAVIEMGANHPGEIAMLAAIAEPQVSVITVCAPAHLEGFGSIEGVAAAKGEIYDALAPTGIAIINGDDAFAPAWRERVGQRKAVTFGLGDGNDFRAEGIVVDCVELTTRFRLLTPAGDADVTLALAGQHNVMNALAAAACTSALGIALDKIVAGLSQVAAVHGRLQRRLGIHGSLIIDDTYNANPGSVKAALAVLAQCNGRRIFVLGDMGELGPDTRALHAELGADARRAAVDLLVTVGDLAEAANKTFAPGESRHFNNVEAATHFLNEIIDTNCAVLVKASRAMGLERIVNAISVGEVPQC
ncbi:MAG: UDP-N-acetylmuramoyl-tripeptide--D-alanyl-D-alanine ligase [Gammaproteobacteria bacterium]|nr:UDP-N-acetylmuramoyl-tripeptide--D-alanyl-D-alanine ligase [Gammaproteobacteria bacterium]